MKALVLVGGFGTRLRPLSCTRPKMLFPLANQALLDWTLKNLAEGGVDTVVLAVNYMAESLVRYFGPTKFDLGIIYSREGRPLGTGGPIKKAADLLIDDEPFLVLNGDIISDIDYQRLVEHHRSKGAVATIALMRVQDPSRYGAVEQDGDGRVLRFVEKPERGEAPSNLINAGIYVFEKEVLDYIPDGRKVSTEEEVFPILAKEGKLYGLEVHGLWLDIGVPEAYLEANQEILQRLDGPGRGEDIEVHKTTQILDPSYLGEGVKVGSHSVIGPNTSISEHVHIGEGCKIENSIIFPGATIGDYSSVRNAIIGENSILERWVKVESGSLIGDYAIIMDGVTITEGVTICPSKTVSESILQPGQVM
ncbi:MAG: NDP-sugar synthase [Candidatus Bathyarchaeota archaeon]|nr:MAG: NDP-sugar synthase [Candidatus Bathyarchaeota archaeon]